MSPSALVHTVACILAERCMHFFKPQTLQRSISNRAVRPSMSDYIVMFIATLQSSVLPFNSARHYRWVL